eukprot:TRINITY_DN1129_c0_g1_i1.p1 TRINITY_DN1129_c0_g1~~TRINITY_DN1129_c0_g1_i1.p1  ORF type:complete len:338 (-),score=56.30 TRINITY_DN1129_c0_g1_i1:30-1016(-)
MACTASQMLSSNPCTPSYLLPTASKTQSFEQSRCLVRGGLRNEWVSRVGACVSSGAKSSTGRRPCRVSASYEESRLAKSLEEFYMDSPSVRSEQQWGTVTKQHPSGVWSMSNAECPPMTLMGGPIVAQQGQGPPPMLMERFQSVISQLFQNRIIRLGGAVEDDMANLIVAQLLYLDAVDPNKDIVMYVNSPGGSVTAGMAVFDTMRHIRPSVSTVCVGLAASMGAFLLSSGTKGKRYSLPNSRIMIHQPLGGAQGQQTDIEIQTNEILHHKANLNGYLAYQTGQPLEKIIQDTDRDFFMSAKEAKEYGLIDEVITNPLKALSPLPAPV